MTSILKAGLFAGGLLFSASAMAQVSTGSIAPYDRFDLPMEQETVVREYIVREAPMIVEGGGTVRPGSIIPDWIRLRPFSNIGVEGLRDMAYFVSPDDKIVIVHPDTREVMRIVSR